RMPKSARAMQSDNNRGSASSPMSYRDNGLLPEEHFHRAIALERRRSERSGKAFLLMLVESASSEKRGNLLSEILLPLSLSTRETDIRGWYSKDVSLGVIFTEIGADNKASISDVIRARITQAIRDHLPVGLFGQVDISFHVFPDEWNHENPTTSNNPRLYPDLLKREDSRRVPRILKRTIDVLGSMSAILLFSPIFVFVAAAIKMSSRGPVLFRQTRVGQYGAPFTLLKFRSMYVNNDDGNHREYVRKLIAGKAETQPSNGNSKAGQGVYKLTRDSRITFV